MTDQHHIKGTQSLQPESASWDAAIAKANVDLIGCGRHAMPVSRHLEDVSRIVRRLPASDKQHRGRPGLGLWAGSDWLRQGSTFLFGLGLLNQGLTPVEEHGHAVTAD